MSLSEIKAEDRRGAILRMLAKDVHGSASESMIDRELDTLGPAFRATRDQVMTDLSWLSQQNLVTLDEIGGYTIATLTQFGRDAAAGDAIVPGVSRDDRRPRG